MLYKGPLTSCSINSLPSLEGKEAGKCYSLASLPISPRWEKVNWRSWQRPHPAGQPWWWCWRTSM